MKKKRMISRTAAAVLLAACLLLAAGCTGATEEDPGSYSGLQESQGEESGSPQESGNEQEGSGTSTLEGMLGSADAYLFAGNAWYTDRQTYLQTAGEWFPVLAGSEWTEEENGWFRSPAVLAFSDIPYTAQLGIQVTDTDQVQACTLAFSFDTGEESWQAFLRGRGMMTVSFGAPEETLEAPAGDLPGGAVWLAGDGSRARLSMEEDGCRFSITLTGQEVMG